MNNVWYYDTVLGRIGIVDNGQAITRLFFAGEGVVRDAAERESPLIRQAARELREYLAGERQTFDVPLEPQGTAFQTAAWNALLSIPYGETRSYGQMAASIGNPKACRAVGLANNKNPIAVMIPCHRVVGANGSLTGYAGGLDKKQLLLDLERGTL